MERVLFRIRLALGRALRRVSDRLLRGEAAQMVPSDPHDSAEGLEPDAPCEQPGQGGPPAHWVELVRSVAPEFLDELPPMQTMQPLPRIPGPAAIAPSAQQRRAGEARATRVVPSIANSRRSEVAVISDVRTHDRDAGRVGATEHPQSQGDAPPTKTGGDRPATRNEPLPFPLRGGPKGVPPSIPPFLLMKRVPNQTKLDGSAKDRVDFIRDDLTEPESGTPSARSTSLLRGDKHGAAEVPIRRAARSHESPHDVPVSPHVSRDAAPARLRSGFFGETRLMDPVDEVPFATPITKRGTSDKSVVGAIPAMRKAKQPQPILTNPAPAAGSGLGQSHSQNTSPDSQGAGNALANARGSLPPDPLADARGSLPGDPLADARGSLRPDPLADARGSLMAQATHTNRPARPTQHIAELSPPVLVTDPWPALPPSSLDGDPRAEAITLSLREHEHEQVLRREQTGGAWNE